MMDPKKGEENVNTTKTGNSATTNQTSNTVEQKKKKILTMLQPQKNKWQNQQQVKLLQ